MSDNEFEEAFLEAHQAAEKANVPGRYHHIAFMLSHLNARFGGELSTELLTAINNLPE